MNRPDLFHQAVTEIAKEVRQIIGNQATSAPDEGVMLRELTCCLLSSQVRYSDAQAFATHLLSRGVLHRSRSLETLESSVLLELTKPLLINGSFKSYRFPAIRSRQLARTLCTVESQFGSLTNLVAVGEPQFVRQLMIQYFPGIGPKQASMFLRNIGLSYDLAVIDRHVIRYMAIAQLTTTDDAGPQSLRDYMDKERILADYSREIGHPVGIVDWAIWIVMRAAGGAGLA